MERITDFIEQLSEQAYNWKKVRLAQACKAGDAMAMYKMAYLMRSRCNSEEIELLVSPMIWLPEKINSAFVFGTAPSFMKLGFSMYHRDMKNAAYFMTPIKEFIICTI